MLSPSCMFGQLPDLPCHYQNGHAKSGRSKKLAKQKWLCHSWLAWVARVGCLTHRTRHRVGPRLSSMLSTFGNPPDLPCRDQKLNGTLSTKSGYATPITLCHGKDGRSTRSGGSTFDSEFDVFNFGSSSPPTKSQPKWHNQKSLWPS